MALIVVDAIWQGLKLESEMAGLRFAGIGLVVVFMPVLVFSLSPLWIRDHPFSAKAIREWVNWRFGLETYESYTRIIRPLALMAAGCIVLGGTAVVSGIIRHAPESVYVFAGFYLSGGCGAIICRVILRRRGNTIE